MRAHGFSDAFNRSVLIAGLLLCGGSLVAMAGPEWHPHQQSAEASAGGAADTPAAPALRIDGAGGDGETGEAAGRS